MTRKPPRAGYWPHSISGRNSPRFSVEHHRQVFPFRGPAALERTLAGLRKAGLK